MNLQFTPGLASHDLERLKKYHWTGNVRELQTIVERALILSGDGNLVFPELSARPEKQKIQPSLHKAKKILTMDQATAMHIRLSLKQSKGKISGKGGAAELLQMNEGMLRFRMKKLGVGRDEK